MKTVNNKTTYHILADQMERIVDNQLAETISQKDINVANVVSKIAEVQIKMLNYELQRAIRTSSPLRELESKAFDNTI